MSETLHPRYQEIIDLAEKLWEKKSSLSSQQLLELMSASFVAPIRLLKEAKGEQEADKETPMRCAYNLLRFGDTAEDRVGLSFEERQLALRKFEYVIGEVARLNGSKEFDKGIEDIIKGAELQTAVQLLQENNPKIKEKIFVAHFGSGPVLRELYGLNKEIRKSLEYVIGNMSCGMIEFLERKEIQTVKQLDDYCYRIAGSVGEFSNRLVRHVDGRELDENEAITLGIVLQYVNILKNAHEDHQEGRSYLPAAFRPSDVGHHYMMEGEGTAPQNAREIVFGKMLGLFKEKFPNAVHYIQAIPSHLSGYKAFCLLPTLLAYETIKTMCNAGAERVFHKGEESAIKIPYGLESTLVPFVSTMVKFNQEKSLNNWLIQYSGSPSAFSFEPSVYAQWSPSFLGVNTHPNVSSYEHSQYHNLVKS